MNKFQLWCRRLTPIEGDPWSMAWNDMPYALRSRSECEYIIREYERQFGDVYEYVYFPNGVKPPGFCLPTS